MLLSIPNLRYVSYLTVKSDYKFNIICRYIRVKLRFKTIDLILVLSNLETELHVNIPKSNLAITFSINILKMYL